MERRFSQKRHIHPSGVAILLLALAMFVLGCSSSEVPSVETPKGEVSVHVIDVGQGDAILIHAPGRVMMVDAGPREASDALVGYLETCGVEEIDLLMVTHPHSDHIGGVPAILDNFRVGQVVSNGATHTTRAFELYLEAIESHGVPLTLGRAGDRFALAEGVRGEVLHPADMPGDDLNSDSLVIALSVGNVIFLLMGDLPREEEVQVAREADVLKVSHHGSGDATGSLFLDIVRPGVAVISVGENPYGHPHDEVVESLNTRGIQVYRTDIDGTVVITTDGHGYEVKASRGSWVIPVTRDVGACHLLAAVNEPGR